MAVLLAFVALTVLAALLPIRALRLRGVFRVSCAALLAAAAMVVRYLCMDHITADYTTFLTVWVQFFRDNGGFAALSQSVGNYNIPYLYFLAAFSYLRTPDLYLIKLLSVAFDVLLAWGSMRLVMCFVRGTGARLAAFFTVLFLPTVVLNGAYWGQCDSIYTALAVVSIYLALTKRPVAAVAFIALSFALKLQAVFLMPVFFLFLCTGRIKWYHLAVFPATYVLVILPAVLLGRPFLDTLLLYYHQGATVGSGLNYNSPSIYAFFTTASPASITAGIVAAFALVFLIYALVLAARKRADGRVLLCVCVLFAVGIPWFLPHMHDRYFFPADVFTVIWAFTVRWRFPIPALTSFASLLGYHAYLRGRYLLPMNRGSAALAAVLALLLADLCAMLFSPSGEPPLSRAGARPDASLPEAQ